jgi:electron transfer flavoprotein beta subunit
MKIIVCISHVPDTTSKINFTEEDTKFDRNGVQFVINPNDEFGLTRAMWFKEKQGATVDVINVGLSDTESTLRKALAIGADKAIRIDMSPQDGYSVATQLASYIKKENYDLVIAGRESIDYNGGMVPGMIAGLNDANFINNCISLEIDGANAIAVREIDGGRETIESCLPIVIGGQKGLVEESDLRIPNMRGIMMARKKQLEVIAPIDSSNQTTSMKFEKPIPKGEVTLISPDNLDELINLLHNEAKVI